MAAFRALCALVLAALPAALGAFELRGWERGMVLSNNGRPVASDDGFPVRAAALDGSVIAFVRSGAYLRAVPVGPGSAAPARDVVPADPRSQTVVKEHGGAVYVLAFHRGEYRLYRLVSARSSPEILFRFPYGLDFGADFFFPDDPPPAGDAPSRVVVSLPEQAGGRFGIKLLVFSKRPAGSAYDRKDLDFPEPGGNDKGSFFFRLFREKTGYSVYFIRRFFDAERKYIGDSIFTFTADSLDRIPAARPRLLVPFGYSDHPPEVLEHRGSKFILYSRKRGPVYSFRILELKTRLEYTVSRDSLNAFDPAFFFRDGIVDLFYLGRGRGLTRILNRRVELDRLGSAEYLVRSWGDREVPGQFAGNVTSVAAAVSGDRRFLLYRSEPGGLVGWTTDDHSAPAVELQTLYRTADGISFPVWTWKEPADPAGIAGYALLVDRNPDTEPVVVNMRSGERMFSARDWGPGKYFLHIRAVDTLGNAGPVRNVPFEVRPSGFVPARRNRLEAIGDALRAVRLELEISNRYETAAYAALLGSYAETEKLIEKRSYPLARQSVSRVALIEPARMETGLYRQMLRKRERSVLYRYDFVLVLAGGLLIVSALILVSRRLERR